MTGLSEPEQVRSLRMTHGTLDALAVPPAIGRWFTLQDDTPGTPETVILMHGYWERRFGADASVIGRTLNIDSTPRVVIGVMPAGFRFIDTDADMILPLRFDRSRVVLGNFSYQGVARLQPGATVEQANADVGRLLPIWLKGWPAPFGLDAKIYGVISYSVSQRTREIGIRMALGVKQGELRGMFVRHGLVLALIGIGVGIAVAAGLTRLMTSLLFQVSPLDALTYVGVSAVLVAAAVLASYLPARRAAALDPVEALRAE